MKRYGTAEQRSGTYRQASAVRGCDEQTGQRTFIPEQDMGAAIYLDAEMPITGRLLYRDRVTASAHDDGAAAVQQVIWFDRHDVVCAFVQYRNGHLRNSLHS